MLLVLLLCGCTQEMANQRRVESQEQTDVFPDGTASRAIPEHTIIASAAAAESVSVGPMQANRRWLASADEDDTGGYLTGKSNGELVNTIPDQVLTRYDYDKLLLRGRERFNISCVPCHDQTGSGNGMVARRGLKFPPSYHTDRLRKEPLGYLFNVATNGRGKMPAYGDYLSNDDRWAIVAYVRTLQFAQYADLKALEQDDLEKLPD
ncbi:MAG: cytochrome c [Planctomycetota bacterium]